MKKFLKKIARHLFPFSKEEVVQWLPMLCLGFFIGINYTILRNIKDSILITAKNSGADVIPFIKVWGVVPSAFIFTFIYSKLSQKLKPNSVFYIFLSFFIGFVLLFSFVAFPNIEYLTCDYFSDFLTKILPQGFKGFIAMIRYWPFSLFYITAEMWSSIMLSVIFWKTINSIANIKNASFAYPLLSLALNLSTFTAGQISISISSNWIYKLIPIFHSQWEQTLCLSSLVIGISGLVIFKSFKKVFSLTPKHTQKPLSNQYCEKKEKTSFLKSIHKTLRSPHLLSIAVVILSYNLIIHLTEVLWKHEVHLLCPEPQQFNNYMNHVSVITGLFSSIVGLCIARPIFNKFGWKTCALITPVVILFTSLLFFPMFISKNTITARTLIHSIGFSPLALIALIGSIQNSLCRTCKFSFFDPTKEMAFIPLSEEERSEGKSIIDGIGSRIGKSGGSFAYQGLLIWFSSISIAAPLIGALVICISICWILSINFLNKYISNCQTKKP